MAAEAQGESLLRTTQVHPEASSADIERAAELMRRGFGRLLAWGKDLGEVTTFGIEGTGSYGATEGQLP